MQSCINVGRSHLLLGLHEALLLLEGLHVQAKATALLLALGEASQVLATGITAWHHDQSTKRHAENRQQAAKSVRALLGIERDHELGLLLVRGRGLGLVRGAPEAVARGAVAALLVRTRVLVASHSPPAALPALPSATEWSCWSSG